MNKNKTAFLFLIIFLGVVALGNSKFNIKNRAWDVLTTYLEAAKNHDLETVRELSYQLSESCREPVLEEDCNARMNTVYVFGSGFKKEDFVNIWKDDKQIILSTDFQTITEGNLMLRARSIIYFMIQDGKIKILKFNPSQGALLSKEEFKEAELSARLIESTEDKDMDGVEDYLETDTDPSKRDSDEDGFWDGVEKQFLPI